MKRGLVSLVAATSLVAIMALAACEPKEPAGEISFITPKDGAEIRPTSAIVSRVKDIKRVPAGTESKENVGYVVILVDMDELPPLGQPVPKGAEVDKKDHANLTNGTAAEPHGDQMIENIVQIISGEADVRITVTPGPHTIQLMMVDPKGVPLDPYVISPKITVTAEGRQGGLQAIPGADRPGSYQGTKPPKN